jgi:mono/diheme cytochrome c family protein
MHPTICGIALLFSCWTVQAGGMSAAHINYILHCQGCHLVDGAGTADKVPALKQEVGRFLQVEGGREFLIQVPGTSQSALSDTEVADVLNWILENFSPDELPADFVPYTTKEISQHRQPLANVTAVRTELVAQISATGANAALE